VVLSIIEEIFTGFQGVYDASLFLSGPHNSEIDEITSVVDAFEHANHTFRRLRTIISIGKQPFFGYFHNGEGDSGHHSN